LATVTVHVSNEVFVINANGELGYEDMITIANEYNANTLIRVAVWNLANSNLSIEARARIKQNTLSGVYELGSPPLKKIIFVTEYGTDYSLLSILSVMAEVHSVGIEYHTCRSMNDARDWIH